MSRKLKVEGQNEKLDEIIISGKAKVLVSPLTVS
jgi:hypothetical protein